MTLVTDPPARSARYLSGVQPSGKLHLGNYFGAIRQHVARQDGAGYFIANYHALTTLRDAKAMRENTLDVAATYLALGLDPTRATLYRQSDVPEVTELMWMLMTVTGMGLLERAVSYKEKKEAGIAATVGLFGYPALMAADILAYDADVVPVGSDQLQHIEITQDMAGHFNSAYGSVFTIPRPEVGTPTPVPGLDGRKMSKSYKNTIPIFASGKELKELVMAIKTGSTPLGEPKDPATCSVFGIYAMVAAEGEREAMAERYRRGGYGYGHAKVDLYNALEEHFAGARTRLAEFGKRPDLVEDVLRDGARRARAKAQEVTARARAACGITVTSNG